MHQRLTPHEFFKVRRMLARKMRQIHIARELGLSVWTISRIADTLRYLTDPINEDDLPVDDAPPDYVVTNLRRCPGCGAMVYVWPCIACKLGTATLGAVVKEEEARS